MNLHAEIQLESKWECVNEADQCAFVLLCCELDRLPDLFIESWPNVVVSLNLIKEGYLWFYFCLDVVKVVEEGTQGSRRKRECCDSEKHDECTEDSLIHSACWYVSKSHCRDCCDYKIKWRQVNIYSWKILKVSLVNPAVGWTIHFAYKVPETCAIVNQEKENHGKEEETL